MSSNEITYFSLLYLTDLWHKDMGNFKDIEFIGN